MGNVIDLPVVTRLDIPADKVLNRALDAGLQSALVVGWTEDGDFYFSSSMADGGDLVWLLEKAKHALLTVEV